jgi:hypothetical protein
MSRLLVSARHRVEAEAALDGGADLIDVKDPKNGPMGRADDSIIQSIVETIAGRAPLSAACGELSSEPPSLPGGLEFVKFGLAGWGDGDWLSACQWVRARLPGDCKFVAVAYADWPSCSAPPPEEIADAAIEHRFGAFLLDTHDKRGGTLLDHASVAAIALLTRRCQSGGLPVALAGSLGLDEIERLRLVNPDWFAVRGAACENGRDGRIDSRLVRRLKEALASKTRVAATTRQPEYPAT